MFGYVTSQYGTIVGIILMGSVFVGFYNLVKDTGKSIKRGNSTFGDEAAFFYILITVIVLAFAFIYGWATGKI